MNSRLTQFGVKCRELRTRYGLTMGDQAKGLRFSVAYISAIERGNRPVPNDYADRLCEWMSLPPEDGRTVRELASAERPVVKVYPKSSEQALLAQEFARDLNGLSPENVRQLLQVLRTVRSGKYPDREIQKRAHLARAVFSLGDQISFNILRIIENQLPLIDPDFSLQVDPDGSLGENLHIYSDSDGKTVHRFVTTEWQYNAADRETDDSRFKLAHELAHWILHRTEALTFLRSARTNRILSKVHAVAEHEADFFAREFLMPLSVVEKFATPEALAKTANVPLWVARVRWREISVLTSIEREHARLLAAEFSQTIEASPPQSQDRPSKVRDRTEVATAVVLPFPISNRPRPIKKQVVRKTGSLPLFEYADASAKADVGRIPNRSDKWFTDYGWRG